MNNLIPNLYLKSQLLYIMTFLIIMTSSIIGTDLKPKKVSLKKSPLMCTESSNIIVEVCNINIIDAQANEWHASVIVMDQNENKVFEEDVPGVFLANGSSASPTCAEIETENLFTPENNGTYFLSVDVNYLYDIDTGNDELIEEISITCDLGAIHGQKFLDINNNGIADSNEVGVNGVLVKLFGTSGIIDSQITHSMDLNDDGIIDPINETGLFWFDSLAPGSYTVSEDVPQGWQQTYPAGQGSHTIELSSGEIKEGVLFGNYANLWDFGDLPEPLDSNLACILGQCYPTKLPLGAAHVAVGPLLGDLRDTESDGLPTYTADGDDTTGVDDEDGVKFIKFNPDATGEVEVKVSGVPADFPAYLAAWIDYDGDGQLAPSEKIFSTVIPSANVYNLTFSVPANVTRGGAARFRISTDPNSVDNPFGPAIDGEVEDYFAYGLDYGDANEDVQPVDPQFPMGYPVKTNSNGARHVIVPTMRLGDELTDNEQNGEASQYSNSDDNDNREDENGIVYGEGFGIAFQGPDPDKPSRTLYIYGAKPNSNVKITPLATQGGLLNLWIDWNRDGDWKDDGEQIFDDVPIVSGPNYTTLTFNVPSDASEGYTYARYRFSSQIGLEYYGGAPNGEVEDHLIKIDPTITDIKDKTSELLPDEYRLNQNYPNPFNPTTTIKYSIPAMEAKFASATNVLLKVFDVLGREVKTLVNKVQSAGNYEVTFDASDLTSGIYYYQLKAGDFIKTRKMSLLK